MSIFRHLHRLFVSLFALGVATQFFLAGAGVFRAHGPGRASDSMAFNPHRTVGHLLLIVALLVLVSGLIAYRRWKAPLALLVLTFVQGVLAGFHGWVGGLHPLNGLLIVGITVPLIRHVYEPRLRVRA